MLSQNEISEIVQELCMDLDKLFPRQKKDVILFGSYVRGDSEFGSDLDLMILVDSDREQIAGKSREISDAAGELLLEYGILISPIVENRAYFQRNADIFPFYRNILREGVRLGA